MALDSEVRGTCIPSVGRPNARRAAGRIAFTSGGLSLFFRSSSTFDGKDSGIERSTLGAERDSTVGGQEGDVSKVLSTSSWTGAMYLQRALS